MAQRIQLSIEYDPAPPFVGGSPQTTPGDILAGLAGFYAKRNLEFGPAVTKAYNQFSN
jgi:cyclohexyl-isocyanide hydratase